LTPTTSTASETQPASGPTSLDILERLLEANRESVIVVDGTRRVIAANRAAEIAFGRPYGSMHSRLLSEVIRDLQLHEAFGRALDEGTSTEVKMDFIGSGKRSYDIHVSPIDLDGSPHAIGVFYDVTQVERLEKVRQEFLSNISHELRTPLTSILAFVETLEDGAIDDKENNRRFLGVIRRNAERMHELIADILELSMIESGNVSIETKPVRLTGLIDEVFTSLSSKAAEREVILVNRAPADLKASADPVRLEQMLTNLIDNAIKFNRRGGSVTVAASGSDERVSISVADTGEGILPDHLPRVFERFYRADRGRTREVGGTGLGLAIVKHLARLHGGEVSVTSTPSQGTTFTIELPA
jgi:two-component system, OmpR family, phosphate regulon sensor histidine kinase PhoR